MGRSYPSELRRIPETIDWALRQDIAALRRTLLRELGGHNLVAIGSGGSLVAALFAALLHEAVTGRLAGAATPLEAITRSPPRDIGALLCLICTERVHSFDIHSFIEHKDTIPRLSPQAYILS